MLVVHVIAFPAKTDVIVFFPDVWPATNAPACNFGRQNDDDVGVGTEDSGDAAGDKQSDGLSLLVEMAPTWAGPFMFGDARLSLELFR